MKKVLALDDQKSMQNILNFALKKDFDVTVVGKAADAVENAKKRLRMRQKVGTHLVLPHGAEVFMSMGVPPPPYRIGAPLHLSWAITRPLRNSAF